MKVKRIAIGVIVVLMSGVLNVFAQDVELNPTLQTIFKRKSVRVYKEGAVSEDQLSLLARAGMAAPTAVDRRPWDFILISDKAVLAKLAEVLPYAKMASQAAAAIVVTGDLERQFGGKDSVFWPLDCSAASENILLAAESMGLGAVWTAVYPDQERIQAVKNVLGIPENVIPLNFIPIGIPAGNEKPKDKFDPQRIHKNTW